MNGLKRLRNVCVKQLIGWCELVYLWESAPILSRVERTGFAPRRLRSKIGRRGVGEGMGGRADEKDMPD